MSCDCGVFVFFFIACCQEPWVYKLCDRNQSATESMKLICVTFCRHRQALSQHIYVHPLIVFHLPSLCSSLPFSSVFSCLWPEASMMMCKPPPSIQISCPHIGTHNQAHTHTHTRRGKTITNQNGFVSLPGEQQRNFNLDGSFHRRGQISEKGLMKSSSNSLSYIYTVYTYTQTDTHSHLSNCENTYWTLYFYSNTKDKGQSSLRRKIIFGLLITADKWLLTAL